jgi:hypothetical protein
MKKSGGSVTPGKVSSSAQTPILGSGILYWDRSPVLDYSENDSHLDFGANGEANAVYTQISGLRLAPQLRAVGPERIRSGRGFVAPPAARGCSRSTGSHAQESGRRGHDVTRTRLGRRGRACSCTLGRRRDRRPSVGGRDRRPSVGERRRRTAAAGPVNPVHAAP